VSATARVRVLVAILCAAGFIFGCAGSGDKEESVTPGARKNERASPVEVVRVTKCDFDDAILATGRFEANERVDISPKIPGRIERMDFDEGDFVEKGNLIVKIEDNEMRFSLDRVRAELKRREADLAGAESALERARELHEKSIATEANLEDAQRLYDMARAGIEQVKAEIGLAEQRLADTEIVAPLDGVLTNRRYAAGELVTVGIPIFELLQLSPIKIEIRVPERRIAELSVGLKADVTVDALGEAQYTGEISYMNPSLDEVSRNLMVRVIVPNEDMKIKPGMFARARISTGAHQDILAVPRDAVMSTSDEYEVFVVEDGLARKRPVDLGAEWRAFVEVVSGVAEGDVIVSAGQHVIRDGTKVNVVARAELRDLLAESAQ